VREKPLPAFSWSERGTLKTFLKSGVFVVKVGAAARVTRSQSVPATRTCPKAPTFRSMSYFVSQFIPARTAMPTGSSLVARSAASFAANS
jgi:hypothetical protein